MPLSFAGLERVLCVWGLDKVFCGIGEAGIGGGCYETSGSKWATKSRSVEGTGPKARHVPAWGETPDAERETNVCDALCV